ncbi:MAG: hypothetical protein NT062_04245 [Proteobacteria bacterium]|nr:hypothetical protein [Pseudomonadota bacterium]
MKLHLTDDTLRALKLPENKAQLVAFDTKVTGFGVVIGRTATTFIVNRRVGAKLHRETIGRWTGAGGDIDARAARKQATVLLGRHIEGAPTPGKVRRVRSSGPTLSDACSVYVESMRASGARPTSIASVDREIGHEERSYLKAWLDRPLASITGKECRARHVQIATDNGPHLANRVMRELRAIWNHIAKEVAGGTIDGFTEGTVFPANPTIAVEWITERNAGTMSYVERRGEPVPWVKLPAWHAAVMSIPSGVRRDYNLLVILTGLRRRDAATLRWEHINTSDKPLLTRVWNASKKDWGAIDLPARSMVRPSPKGGASRSFIVPLSSPIVAVLERRRTENGAGDGGWVFPTTALKSDADRAQRCYLCADLGMPGHVAGEVTHLSEPKEHSPILVAPHRLRDTYTTALADIKDPPLSPYVIDVLTNHRSPRGSVTAGYIGALDLLQSQERASAYLVERFVDR